MMQMTLRRALLKADSSCPIILAPSRRLKPIITNCQLLLQKTLSALQLSLEGHHTTHRQVCEGDAEIVSVLGVEAGVVDEIDAATDHIASSERRSVRLPCA